ncbi:MAG: hypothetical protein WC654_08560 [Patescibacteria group bacterium]
MDTSHLLSLIDDSCRERLNAHGVTPEQYLSWLMRGSRPLQLPAWLVVGVSIVGSLLLVVALTSSGNAVWDAKLLILGSATAVSLLLIFGLTSWTMRHATNPLAKKMLMLDAVRKLSPASLDKLRVRDWELIAQQKSDLDLSIPQNEAQPNARDRRLHLWQKWFGWTALICGLGSFFVSASYQSLLLPLSLSALGAWMAIRGTRIAFMGIYRDAPTDLIVTGGPAKTTGVISIIFGSIVSLLGLIATVQWFL